MKTHTRQALRSPITLGALLGLAACGGEPGARGVDEWQATVDTVGDTITVRTVSGGRGYGA